MNSSSKGQIVGTVASSIISIVLSSIVIYVLIKLRDVSCNCIVDWRNSFGVFAASFAIIMAILSVLISVSGTKFKTMIGIIGGLVGLSYIANLINLYGLYTYTRDLTNSKCSCIEKNEPFYSIVYYLIRIQLVLLLLWIVLVLIFIPFGDRNGLRPCPSP
jgi:hypothetical protein